MKQIYFVAGLGTSEDDVRQLRTSLSGHNIYISYLDLPGQFSQKDTTISSTAQLHDWFSANIPSRSHVVGYSLGADLLLACLPQLNLASLILLDGGVLNCADMGTTLQEELDFSKRFIEENKLDMDFPTVLNLLRIRESRMNIFAQNTVTPLYLVLSDTPSEILNIKRKKLLHNKNTQVSSEIIAHSSHQLFVESPDAVVRSIARFLDQV